MAETNLASNLPDFVHCCAVVKHLPPKLPFCHKILTECKFLVNHTRSIGEIHSCSKCRQYIRDCPHHDITQVVVCPTLSRHDFVLGERWEVRDRQSMRGSNPDCAGWSKLCWMHDPSIRPKRQRRAWTTTYHPENASSSMPELPAWAKKGQRRMTAPQSPNPQLP